MVTEKQLKVNSHSNFVHAPHADNTQRLIDHLRRGAPWCMLWTPNGGEHGDKKRSAWYAPTEPVTPPPTWSHKNVYFGVSPSAVRREYYQASTDETIAAVNALYAEFDGKDFTAPSNGALEAHYKALRTDHDNAKKKDKALWNEAQGDAQDAEFLTNPAHYKTLAKAHIDALTPAPSAVWDSGGGYQCVWLLADTFLINTEADRAHVKDIQKRWVSFVGGDPGAHDLRRVLRLPGTHNHKKKYAPNYPLVAFVKTDFDLQYTLDELSAALPAPAEAPQPTEQNRPTAQRNVSAPYEGESVIDAYNAANRIEDALASQGYVKRSTSTRNGQTVENWSWSSKGSGASVEVFPATNTSYHRSSRDPLHGVASPFGVYCCYEHNGNVRQAVKAAAAALGMAAQREVESIKTKLQRCRQWVQTADFAALVPQALQSTTGYRTNATDKRLYSALLDTLEQYERLRGPISNQQLALASGLSEGSVRNAMERLIGACLVAKIDPVDQNNESGCFWYELRSLDYILSCVPCAVLGSTSHILHRARYATKVFTDNKTHDAFQRGGSERQRKRATIKAIGPDALIFLDVVSDYGRQTQTAIAERTHQSKYTVSRIVKRLLEHDIITVEAEGTRRYVSLSSEWMDTVKAITPQMPTYGMEFKRKFSAAFRTLDYCDLKAARNVGNGEKIAAQREKAAKQAFDLMTAETLENFTPERQAQIKERMRKHYALQSGAAAFVNVLDKTPETTDFIAFMRSEPKSPWLTTYDNGRMERLAQTLEDNETLIAARQTMRHEDMKLPTINTAPIHTHNQMAWAGAA